MADRVFERLVDSLSLTAQQIAALKEAGYGTVSELAEASAREIADVKHFDTTVAQALHERVHNAEVMRDLRQLAQTTPATVGPVVEPEPEPESELESITYLTATQRKALEKAGFTTKESLREAGADELGKVSGIGPTTARKLSKEA